MDPFLNPDNDDAMVGTIYSRREAMLMAARAGFGLMAFGPALATLAQTKSSVHLVASPILTEGPFFVDEKLNRSNLIAGTKRPTVVEGLPLTLSFTVQRLKSGLLAPVKGVHVDVWHADAAGVYSDESNPMNNENTAHQQWLRGYQVTDNTGKVTFKTVFPGWYQGRTTHIHFKIRQYSAAGKVTAEFTSQLFFDAKLKAAVHAKHPYSQREGHEIPNERDNIYGERQADGTMAGTHLTPTVQAILGGKGYVAHFSVALTGGNFNTNHHEGPGGPGGPGGPSGGWGPPPPPPDDWF